MRDSEILTKISQDRERVKKLAVRVDCVYLMSFKEGQEKLRIYSISIPALRRGLVDRRELFANVQFQPESFNELDELNQRLVVENTKCEVWDLNSESLLISYQKKGNSEFFYTRNHAIVAEFAERGCNLAITDLSSFQTRRLKVNIQALYLVDLINNHLILGIPRQPVKVVNLNTGEVCELHPAAVKKIIKLGKMNDLFLIYKDNTGQFALKTSILFESLVHHKEFDDSENFLCLQEKNDVSVISGNAVAKLGVQGVPITVAFCEDTMEVLIACKDGTIKIYH